MIVTRTPYRISFFGGGTDYIEWFGKYGGAILATTINKYCYVTLSSNGTSWKYFDLNTQSGLATSSAYTVGLLRACSHLDKIALARLAVEWERDKSGNNVGYQDPYVCALGGMLHLTFNGKGVEVDAITEDLTYLQSRLMLVYTGPREIGSYGVIEEQLANVKSNKSILEQIHRLVDEGIKSIGNSDFGYLLNETWQLKKQLSEHTTSSKIDAIYEKALKAGALGGKLLGAGNGGYLLLYAELEKQEEIETILGNVVKFEFESGGSKVVYSDGMV